MADIKTLPTDQNVTDFLESIEDEQKKADSYKLLEIMGEVSNEKPTMWGKSIIGFGSYHYKYESGHEGDTMKIGFSPRKAAITLYLYGVMYQMDQPQLKQIFDNLGKFKHGKGCLYIKKMEDVDEKVLRKLIEKSFSSFE